VQQHQTDDHEQSTGYEEYRLPAGPDRPCHAGEADGTEWIGWTGGRVPLHQIPAK
jgi:hypothetical protein